MSDLIRDTCERVLALVGDRAEAEVTVTSGRSGLTRFANSHIHQNVADSGRWVRLKVVVDGRAATASTSRVASGLKELVERTLEAARLRPVDPAWPGLAPPAAATGRTTYDEETLLAAPEVRAGIVDEFIRAGEGLQGAGFCSTGGHETAFANSAGQRLAASTSSAMVEGIHRSPSADGGGQQIASRVAILDGGAVGRRAAEKARMGADPVDVDPGAWEVILEPNCVADVLDFVTGHGFNAKHHAEGRSFVRLGEAQLDPQITIYDDATDPRTVGLPFDAEGTPRRRIDLVIAGVSTALVHDRRTAAAAGTVSTGHGAPHGEISGPVPTHIFLESGTRTPADLIASVERGLLVTDFWYTRILDPKTTVVTGLTRNGTFLIEDGRITQPVRNVRFTQSYSEALAPGNVLGIGNDARLAGEAQFHTPTLHLKAWNVTGGAKA
jgi:predicted Zn-dependent protease